MAKKRLTPEELDARLRFLIGAVLSLCVFVILFGSVYATMFITQPLTVQSPNDRAFFELLSNASQYLLGGLAGLLVGSSVRRGGEKSEDATPGPLPSLGEEDTTAPKETRKK